MSEELKHIFDNSTCLTRRQLKDYVQGAMTAEERHAVELHLNACPLCSDAVEGMMAAGEQGISALQSLNADFLKNYLPAAVQPPVVKQPARPHTTAPQPEPRKVVPLWRGIAIAASLLLVAGIAWWLNANRTDEIREHDIAQQLPPQVQNSIGEAPTDTITAAAPANATELAKAKTENMAGGIAGAGSTTEAEAPPVMADMPAPVAQQAYAPATANEDARLDQEEKYYSKTTEQPTANMPPPLPGGSRRGAAPDTIEGVTLSETSARTRRTPAPPAAKPQAEPQSGDAAFRNGNWSTALKYYKEEMKSPDRGRRQAATMKAAQCYINLGNKQQATQLLQSIINEGGPQRRTAKKLLRQIGD